MRREVMSILQSLAGRLTWTRAAESAAAAGAAAGLSAAALELAWSVGRVYPAWALAMCLASAIPVVTVCPKVRKSLGLSRLEAVAAGGISAAAGLAGLLALLGGWHVVVPKAAWPVVLVPLGALATAAAVLAHPVSLVQAALYHDLRLGLGERLSTAAELAASDRPDRPLADCVYAQALGSLALVQPDRMPVWRRTRRTAGALALSAVLCAALALLPTLGVVDVPASMERLSEAAGEMSPRQRQDLAATLRQLAEQAKGRPELLEALRAAAAAAERNLPDKLKQELDRTRQALAGEADREAGRIALALLAAAGLTSPGGGPSGGGTAGDANSGGPTTIPDANALANPGEGAAVVLRPLVSRVQVWDPSYARLPAAGSAQDANRPATGPSPSGQGLVPLRDAWAEARLRASSALAAGRIPPEYRRTVRAFFEVE